MKYGEFIYNVLSQLYKYIDETCSSTRLILDVLTTYVVAGVRATLTLRRSDYMTKVVTFIEEREVGFLRTFFSYNFQFNIIDKELIGLPEEENVTETHVICVGVSHKLMVCWQVKGPDLIKVMFEYGKRKIVQDLKDGVLGEYQELLLSMENTEDKLIYNPLKIEKAVGLSFEVEIPKEKLLEDTGVLELASNIINTRDNINALFKQKHKENLFTLPQERSLLELFRPVSTQEEYIFRLAGLTSMVVSFNNNLLRKITGVKDSNIHSVELLNIYLQKEYDKESFQVIEIFKAINRLRQGYPIHGDHDGVIKAHKYFHIEYPIRKYDETWKAILLNYYNGLKEIRDLLGDDYK